MKTTLLKSVPLFALATMAFGQDRPKALPEPDLRTPPFEKMPPVRELVSPVVPLDPGADGTFSISIKKCSLSEAVEKVQQRLDGAGQTRMNIVINVPNAEALKVPDLSLKKVMGPDAVTLIATSVGCELKPILRVGEPGVQPVIGWEIRSPAREYRALSRGAASVGGTSGVRAGNVTLLGGPGTPPTALLGLNGAGDPGGESGGGGSSAPLKWVNEGVFETPPPPLRLEGPGGVVVAQMGEVVAPRPATEKTTRVYPLGTVTSYAKFPEVEQSLRDLFTADGVPAGDVKMSLHDKTNILVINGTERVHALVSQTVAALGKDSSVRDARQNSAELRELRGQIEQMKREIEDRQAQMDMLRKVTQENEIQRQKAETELRLLKSAPQGR